MNSYPLDKKLKDGTEIVLREMHEVDAEQLLAFFKSIPENEREYLRMDVTVLDNIKRRMNPGPFKNIWRLVAEKDGKILADATLCGPITGWMRHVGEIRCIVHPEFQRKGMGAVMLGELFQNALIEKYHTVFCEVVPEQVVASQVLANLGFEKVMIRRNHVKDMHGKKHDLHIFAIDIKKMWQKLKDHLQEFDTSHPHF
jgi:RimJ/RimL family protein N-acetyltransferase